MNFVTAAARTTASLCVCSLGAMACATGTLVIKELKEPFSRDNIVQIMRKACDYQLKAQEGSVNNGWIRSAFYTGVMALHRTSGEAKYLDAATSWGEVSKWTPPAEPFRHADNLCCGQTYTELFMVKKDEAMIAPFRERIDRVMAEPLPGRVDWWWCDALFMAPPALVRLSEVTGDQKYRAFMNDMWWDTTEFLYDKDEHLFYRDKSFFPPAKTANGKKIFWSRGNGWVMGGTVRVLQHLAKNDPNREPYLTLYKQMATKIRSLQGPEGLWRPSLLDPEEFPTPETSGSGFFTYAITWGINNGILDRAEYEPVVKKAWIALVSAVDETGRLGFVQKVAGAPGAISATDTHEYAVGAFLLAGSEIVKLNTQ